MVRSQIALKKILGQFIAIDPITVSSGAHFILKPLAEVDFLEKERLKWDCGFV